MTESVPWAPRVVVATVARGRASATEDASQIVVDELTAAGLVVLRSVTVNRELQFIQQLVSNLCTDNEIDAVILIGGVGLGPRDFTCEAVERSADRRIEGFGEAYRQLLRDEFSVGPAALLARATAGVQNKCVVLALPRDIEPLRRAVQTLVVPTLAQAAELASGRPLNSILRPSHRPMPIARPK